MGAVAAGRIGQVVHGLPPLVAIPLMVVGGALAGAAWALVPALLRVRLGIDEVVTTLLLNPVALLFVKALVQGPWRDPGGITESPPIAERRRSRSSSRGPGCTWASSRWSSWSSPGMCCRARRPVCGCAPWGCQAMWSGCVYSFIIALSFSR